ncbi:MAG: YceI family protein [Myxococcota bacterium]
MARFDASTATCLVYTFKDGLLSKLAHDLKLEVTSFTIEAGPEGITANFDPSALRVVCCMRHGNPAPGTLSARDKRTIEGSIAKEILKASRHPDITFRSTQLALREDGGYTIEGQLSMHGHTRNLSMRAYRKGDTLEASVRLHQPDFGIKPYKALMGTLKIKPEVEVTLSLPADALLADLQSV